MAQRQSRRVRGLAPEIETFEERCFFCLSDIPLRRVASQSIRRLRCCSKFVHTRCQNRWQENHSKCAHCQRGIVQPAAPIWNPPQEIRAVPHREQAREALNLYRESETAFRNRVTREVSNHAFEIWLALKFVLKVMFVVFQFPFFVNPTTWFDLWEALDAYLSFHSSNQPLIVSGNVFSGEPLHFVHQYRLESMVDHLIPISIHMYTSRTRTRFRYFVNRELGTTVTISNLRGDDE